MFARGNSTVELKDISCRISEYNILKHYLGIEEIPIVINSPLREDNHPSLGIYFRNERIYYKDFSTNESGGIYDLLSKMWGLSFKETLQRIYNDLSLDNYAISPHLIITNNRKIYSNKTNLQCKVREWRSYDLEYWDSYGISLKWLKFGDIYPISYIIVSKKNNKFYIPAEKYAYAYVERKDNRVSLKIYQPYSKTHKWSNKHDSSVWDLWTKLPQSGENLIITSSRKDALCIWENSSIPSVSLQAESYLPKEKVINELKERFTHIFVLYDNDFQSEENHGRLFGKAMSNKFSIKQIEIPLEYHSKDTSDLAKNCGRATVKKVILSLINN